MWDRFRDGLMGEAELAALPPPPPPPPAGARSPILAGRGDPTIDRFVRQLQMPMVRRGTAAPVAAPVDQPGLVRVTPPPSSASFGARNSAGEEEFAARRAQYLQAWRQARNGGGGAGGGGPVTVVRGTAEQVYSFDIR